MKLKLPAIDIYIYIFKMYLSIFTKVILTAVDIYVHS